MNDKDDLISSEEEEKGSETGYTDSEELLSDLAECKDNVLRAYAENENIRKRCRREVGDAQKYAIQDFVTRILPAVDSLEKGIDVGYMEDGIDPEALVEGMNATVKIMKEAFNAVGLEEINPVGHKFDPELHEAMVVKHVKNVKPNKVIAVFQKGYILNGRLIRPARVEVSE